MKIIQLHFFLLMWSQAAESLTNTSVTLGADVIINCDLDIKEVYWYRQKSPDPPELILRTFHSTYEKAVYENSTLEEKYSVKTNSRLFIRNISADELGVYYCVKTSESLKFSNGTKIYINNSAHGNQTKLHNAPQQEIPWRILTITSALFNVLLITALIGLGKSYLQSKRLKQLSENPQSTTAAQYSDSSQYAVVDLPVQSSENRLFQEQSVYSLLQPTKSAK